jgi:hypothetical protein
MISLFYYIMRQVKKNAIQTERRKNLEEAQKDAKQESAHKVKHINDDAVTTDMRLREFTRHE